VPVCPLEGAQGGLQAVERGAQGKVQVKH
jgi:hypothetical protein